MPSAKRLSAGLLMYRIVSDKLEVFLAHPGGPYFFKKDEKHWSIPKGEPEEGEELLLAAIREFKEETDLTPVGNFIELGSIKQKGGKVVHAWAFEGTLPDGYVHICNTFEVEWPPNTGKYVDFPEIDEVGFFESGAAKEIIKETQIPLIKKLEEILKNK